MPKIIQSAEGRTTGGVSDFSLAFDSNVTAGRLLLVGAQSWPLVLSEATDTLGNTYALDVEHKNSISVGFFSAKAASSGANTVTIEAVDVPSFFSMTLVEVEGMASANWFDTSVENHGSDASPSAGTLTTGAQSGLAFWNVSHLGSGNPALSRPTGWTQLEEEENTSFNPYHVAYRRTSPSTGYATQGTIGASVDWDVVVANYKAAPGSVVVDFESTGAGVAGDADVNWSHTVTEADVLLVATKIRYTAGGAGSAITSVTRDGQSFTKIRHDQRDFSGIEFRTEIWRLANPNVGTADIVATTGGTAGNVVTFHGSSISLRGLQSTQEAHNGATDAAAADEPHVSVTTLSAGALLFDSVLHTSDPAMLAGFGQAENSNITTGTPDQVGASTKVGGAAGSHDITWSSGENNVWAQSVAAFSRARFVSSAAAGGTQHGGVTTGAIDTSGADILVMAVSCDAGVSPTVSDSKSNVWSPLTLRTSSFVRVRLWYVTAPSVGSGHTFTVDALSDSFSSIAVAAFSGVTSFESENGATASGIELIQPGSVTPNFDDALVVAAIGVNGIDSPYAISDGFTISNQVAFDTGTHYGVALGYVIQPAAAAINPMWAWQESLEAAAAIAAFAEDVTQKVSLARF